MPRVTVDVLPFGMAKTATVLPQDHSPPHADTVVSMLRSLTLDDDYFYRQSLRKMCIQRSPTEDFMPQANEIIPGLFVSDFYTATTPAVLQNLGITHIVSVLSKPDYRYAKPMQHLCVPVEDKEDCKLLDYLDSAVHWIREALEGGGRVLVHCVWGMSRSATVAIAYLIVARSMSLDEAVKAVRSKRRIIRPNAGFMDQLKFYAKVTRLREGHIRRRTTALPKVPEADFDFEVFARGLGVAVPS
ncbi:phosphatases II [Trametes cingulata]|nr:phosphatases II [Trametes cingulata]